jgi:hypothetical protein
MKYFEVGNLYRDRGTNYKRFKDDAFTSLLVDGSNKTIPHMGGMRFKDFNNISIQIPDKQKSLARPYIVLVSATIDTVSDNPWNDLIHEKKSMIKYWGDAKGSRNFALYPGNKAMQDAFDLSKSIKELTPPILHFSKDEIGYVKFNGLCIIKNIKEENYEFDLLPIKNFLFELEILNEYKIPIKWLTSRADSFNPSETDTNYAPTVWNQYIQTNEINLIGTKKTLNKRKIIWDDDKLTVIMWILLHKGFSITDDSSKSNKKISKVMNVKSSSLDMVSRHIKFHCFRLDLYGKKPRFNAKLAHIVDHYRTDQRNLVKDARSIARKNGWNDGLKEFL